MQLILFKHILCVCVCVCVCITFCVLDVWCQTTTCVWERETFRQSDQGKKKEREKKERETAKNICLILLVKDYGPFFWAKCFGVTLVNGCFLCWKNSSTQPIRAYVHGAKVGDVKGVVCNPGKSLLVFELNSQTNTPLPSVLLQKSRAEAEVRNPQHKNEEMTHWPSITSWVTNCSNKRVQAAFGTFYCPLETLLLSCSVFVVFLYLQCVF